MIGIIHECAASLVALCLLSCNGMAQETQAVRDPEIRTASQVSGISIVKVAHLPKSPKDKGDRDDDLCANHLIAATTRAGKAVEQQGWRVTSEVPFGPFQAVSFVGTFEAGPSGTCQFSNGNVGLFSGEHLVALVYADKKSDQAIGRITPFGDQRLRIWDGELLPSPVADMRLVGPSGIVVTPPALEEKVCNARGTVPYVYDLPIDKARRILAKSGWKPVDMRHAGTRSPGEAEVIAKHGIVEVEDCLGTGFGLCFYKYEGPAGGLAVTTAGEIEADGAMPTVVGYTVACSPANR